MIFVDSSNNIFTQLSYFEFYQNINSWNILIRRTDAEFDIEIFDLSMERNV